MTAKQERIQIEKGKPEPHLITNKATAEDRKSALLARILAGSVGSIATSLITTPLDVVKVRAQAASSMEIPASLQTGLLHNLPQEATPCPRGCGTFVLNNIQSPLSGCVLPKSAVSFFDQSTGKLTEEAQMIMADQPSATNNNGGSTGTRSSAPANQLGPLRMVRRIFMEEGFAGIYAGLRPTLVMAVPNTVLYFSAYEEIVWRLREQSNSPAQFWIPLTAGGSARLLASSFTAPFEYLRTRQASMIGQNQPAASMWKEFRIIVKSQGIGALYRGLGPTLYRDVPFSAIYWLSLETLREKWGERTIVTPSPLEQAGQAFFNGAVSGMIAAAATTPFDVVKTRLQTAAQAREHISQPREVLSTCGAVLCDHDGATVAQKSQSSASDYTLLRQRAGTFAYMRDIAKREGISALWSGNQARMLKAAPACAIMISSYELGKRFLEDMF